MSGYPPHQPPSGYPYGAPPSSQSYSSAPYGAPPPGPPQTGQSSAYTPYSAPSAPPYNNPSAPHKPPKDNSYSQPSAPYGAPAPQSYGGYPPPPSAPYGSPFAALVPSAFPPGTDPNVIAGFQMADQDGSGFIDDKELQKALSTYNQSFSLRTVHLLMYIFTNTNIRKIGPKEYTQVHYSLQNWRAIFERFDRDRSGKIDSAELREALLSLGFSVSPMVLDLLVSKFDKSGGKNKAIEYDNFIECCLTVSGLTEKFKEKDTAYSGSATFTYESFMLTVLPFLIA
ncbi:probable calcium-binding protein CML49 [Olea europaea var. sylvestris]|uniref:Probable calcium-binding CML49 n=1 Tax=Olea europaea subsp. europaea TaxID=158383 RepID=A0A8S0S6U3_OLEEU|nr:probable calcium-binding protein CML49 [Olea europaea var. sylvestris]CAA2986965.1 probable calcium-binding CML49 [Olea europaea subsp. europaea]